MRTENIKKFFEEGSYPDYACPECKIGILRNTKLHKVISKKPPLFHEYNWMEEEEYYRDGKEHIFASVLKCSNNSCQQVVSMIGKFIEGYQDCVEETGLTGRFSSYFPKYFYPNLKIFDYPENLPIQLEEEINNSFALYYSDTNGSANKIRRAIELIVTNLGAPKFSLNKKTKRKNRKPLVLHERIVKLGKRKKRTSTMLLGLKIIGNEGSHFNELEIMNNDILEAYEVLEYILNKEFTNKEQEILLKAENLKNRK